MYPQSVDTGGGDAKNIRQYKTMNGINTININYSYWDGNQIQSGLRNPWADFVPLSGTDGSRCSLDLQPDPSQNNVEIYVTAIYRKGSAIYNTTV